MFAGQAPLQVILLLIALVCVPWLLCYKPYMLFKQHQQHTYHSLEGSTTHQPLMSNSTDRMLSGLDVGNPLVQTNMNINQVIHNSAVVDVKENETGTLNGTVNAPRSRTP